MAVALAGLFVAWWLYNGGALRPPALQSNGPSSPGTVVTPIATPPVPAAPQAPGTSPTQTQLDELDAAQARDEAWAEARRESIRVQQRLRDEAAAQRARANALETGDELRCIEGRRMKRVSNGWVDAGTC